MIEFTPEKSKKVALARLDLLNQWKEFRRKSENKLQADYDFVNLHNTIKGYKSLLKYNLLPYFGDMKICEITYESIVDFMQKMKKNTNLKPQVMP